MGFEGIKQMVDEFRKKREQKAYNASMNREIDIARRRERKMKELEYQTKKEQKMAEIRKFQQMNRPTQSYGYGGTISGIRKNLGETLGGFGSHVGYGGSNFGLGGLHEGYGERKKKRRN